ncbi:MAG TPA: GNAT family N-acetyltransferase [Candidatus Limnocylindrales bacterium]|nr:GNAT family N-acetyltransferase [Candidatus Limnocylindrales bacterium]
MTLRVRPFAERDYVAYARIRSIGEREPTEAAAAREADARWDSSRYDRVRVVAVDEEDAAVGYGEIHHEPTRFEPGRYFIRIAVDPDKRRRGIGAALWSHLHAELAERKAVVACLWCDDHTACLPFIARRGFREVIRSYRMVCAVASAPQPTEAHEELLAREGITVTTLADLMRDDDQAAQKAHALDFAARSDQPTLGRVTSAPFESWFAFHVEDPAALPEAYFVATIGGQYVGVTSGRRRASDDVLDIGITAVQPAYRRRGIGRSLKLRLHAYARAEGYREIHTSNAKQNVPMVKLNESLGYVIVESWGGYELALIPSSP